MADLSATTGIWDIDPTHSTIGFSARHAMIAKVRGRFAEFTGSISMDGADPAASRADLTIVASSITTENDDRDGHLRSAEFLDVDTFPTITFVSTGVVANGSSFTVTGDLTIRGVTRPVSVQWELLGIGQDPWGNTRLGFEGTAEISRKEFGLTWNVALEAGGVLVSDNVQLLLDVEAVKRAA